MGSGASSAGVLRPLAARVKFIRADELVENNASLTIFSSHSPVVADNRPCSLFTRVHNKAGVLIDDESDDDKMCTAWFCCSFSSGLRYCFHLLIVGKSADSI